MKVFRCLAVVLVAVAMATCARDAATYISRGNSFLEAGKYADAAIQFEKAAQIQPKSGDAYYGLALALLREGGRGNQALDALQHALSLMPEREDVMTTMADFCFDVVVNDPRRPAAFYDRVTQIAGQLIARNPKSFDGLRLKGNLARLDSKPREALEFLEEANRIRPANPEVVLSLYQLLAGAGDEKRAEALAAELIKVHPHYGLIYDAMQQQFRAQKREADVERVLRMKAANNPANVPWQLDLARYYFEAKKPAEMNGVVNALLQQRNRPPDLSMALGDFYADIGKLADAKQQFEDGARLQPEAKVAYDLRIARLLKAQGNTAEALARVESILRLSPENAEAAVLRAIMLLETGKPENIDTAIASLGTLARKSPGDSELSSNLGLAYYLKGDTDSAEKQLVSALRTSRSPQPVRILLARVYLSMKRYGDAVRVLDDFQAEDPANRQARLLRVSGLMGLDRYAEAREQLNRLARELPGSTDVRLGLGLVAVHEKQYAEAEQIFRGMMLPEQNDPRAVGALADMYAGRNELDRAVTMLTREAARPGSPRVVHRLLADTAVRAGKFDLAVQEYNTLLAADSKSLELHLRLGDAYLKKGDLTAAIARLQTAHQMAPLDARSAVFLAEALQAAGKPNEAIAVYRQAMKSPRPDEVVLNNIAYLLAETGGDLQEALRYAQQATKVELRPGYLDTLGYVYLKSGKTDLALQVLSNLVRKEPQSPTFRYHYGMALLASGDKDRARTELQAALANHPGAEETSKIRALLKDKF